MDKIPFQTDEDRGMRLPQLRLSTLIIVVMLVGLLIGNYARIENQIGANSLHSYGFPPSKWQIMLMAFLGVAFYLVVIGLAYSAARIGWRMFTRRTSRPRS